MKRKPKQSASVGKHRMKLRELARVAGCHLSSIGDVERLAGINTCSEKERHDLWFKFQHLFKAPTEELFDAVMDHCAKIALRRIEAGELCLIRMA